MKVTLIEYVPDPTNDFTPTLEWNELSGVSTYRIQIDDDVSFATPLEDVYVSGAVNLSGPFNYTPGGNLPEGHVFWRVSSDFDYSLFSDTDDFVITSTLIENPAS